MGEGAPEAADDLVLAHAERGGERRAGVLDQAVAVEHPDHVGRVVDERGDARRGARLGLGLGDLRVGGDDRAVGQRRRASRDPDVAAVDVRQAQLLVDAAAVRSTRTAGSCSGGNAPPPGRRRTEASEGAPISRSGVLMPSIRAIASFAFRTTPCGSQTRIPSSRLSGSAIGGAAAAGAVTVRRPSGIRRRGRCRRSRASAGRRRACAADWRCGRRRGGRRRTSSRPRRARAAARGENATRGSAVSVSSRSNSIRVSSSVTPSSLTSRAGASTVSAPKRRSPSARGLVASRCALAAARPSRGRRAPPPRTAW